MKAAPRLATWHPWGRTRDMKATLAAEWPKPLRQQNEFRAPHRFAGFCGKGGPNCGFSQTCYWHFGERVSVQVTGLESF